MLVKMTKDVYVNSEYVTTVTRGEGTTSIHLARDYNNLLLIRSTELTFEQVIEALQGGT